MHLNHYYVKQIFYSAIGTVYEYSGCDETQLYNQLFVTISEKYFSTHVYANDYIPQLTLYEDYTYTLESENIFTSTDACGAMKTTLQTVNLQCDSLL